MFVVSRVSEIRIDSKLYLETYVRYVPNKILVIHKPKNYNLDQNLNNFKRILRS